MDVLYRWSKACTPLILAQTMQQIGELDRGHASHCSINAVFSSVTIYQCKLVLQL